MKKNDTHPKYQKILFIDSATGKKFVCGSTLQPKERETFEGVEYPVYYLPTSSYSHPFFTGSNQLADSEGRVKKFKDRYAAMQQKQQKAKPAS
jgi:large subunit ribosomal protein L31